MRHDAFISSVSVRPCPSAGEPKKRGGWNGRTSSFTRLQHIAFCVLHVGWPSGRQPRVLYRMLPPPWHIYIIVGSIVIGKKENIYEERRGGAGVWALWLGHQLRPPISLSLSLSWHTISFLSLSLSYIILPFCSPRWKKKKKKWSKMYWVYPDIGGVHTAGIYLSIGE